MNDSVKIQIFIYPTDTVWGIGTNATLVEGSNIIADIKKTERGKPLSVLFSNIELLKSYFNLPSSLSEEWLSEFFKAESTLGLPVSWSKGKIASDVFVGMPHVCVRCITSPEVEELIDRAGGACSDYQCECDRR